MCAFCWNTLPSTPMARVLLIALSPWPWILWSSTRLSLVFYILFDSCWAALGRASFFSFWLILSWHPSHIYGIYGVSTNPNQEQSFAGALKKSRLCRLVSCLYVIDSGCCSCLSSLLLAWGLSIQVNCAHLFLPPKCQLEPEEDPLLEARALWKPGCLLTGAKVLWNNC